MPSTEKTKDIHRELLILLKIFDDICTQNDIKYSLHGGTLLGAVRDRGFIPWDDDADVTLTRYNYLKFKLCIDRYTKDGELEFDEYTSHSPMLWRKCVGKPKVWIDIFIYDFVSEIPVWQKLKFLGLVFFLGFTKNKETIKISREGEYRGWKYIVISILYNLGRLFSANTKGKWANWFASKCFIGNRKLIQRSNDQYKGIGLVLPISVMSKYMRVPFENIELFISESYDCILVSCYGNDYMIPQKAHKREFLAHNMYRDMHK